MMGDVTERGEPGGGSTMECLKFFFMMKCVICPLSLNDS